MRTNGDLRAELDRAIIEALPQGVALLDADGVVVAVNAAWAQTGLECEAVGEGESFLDFLRGASRRDPVARLLLNGIEEVLSGRTAVLSFPEISGEAFESRWASIEARALPPRFGGAMLVVNHAAKFSAGARADEDKRNPAASDVKTKLVSHWDEMGWIEETSKIGLCLLDRELRYLRVNRRLAELHGIPVEAHLGRSVFETIPALASQIDEIARRIAETGQGVVNVELSGEIGSAPSDVRNWDTGWHPLLDEARGVVGFCGVIEDMTERKRVEQALKESEERERHRCAELQTLFDIAPVGLSIAVDQSGTRFRDNPAVWQAFGVSPSEEQSKARFSREDFRVFRDGCELTPDQHPMQRAVRGEVVRGDIIEVERSDGEKMNVFAKAMPLYDACGHVRGAVGAFMDITKIKEAENAIRESEKRFRILVDSFSRAVWEANAEGFVVEDSPSWRAFTGQTRDDFLGRGWLRAIHPDDRERVERQWRAAAASTQLYDVECRLQTQDGGWRWTEIRAVPNLGPEGKLLKWTGMIVDIEARKQAESSLRETEERQAFLLKLIDNIRNLVDPGEIQAVACRMLCEFLGVNRVAYADIEGEEFIVRQGYARGVDPFLVRLPVADLGAKLVDSYRLGETVAIENVFDEEGFSPAEHERFRAGQIAALMSLGLTKAGKWVGALCAHNATPRAWRPYEIILLREVAERIWSSTERARALVALRESEFRLQLALGSGKIGVYEVNVETKEAHWDDRLLALWGISSKGPVSYERFMQGVHLVDRERVARALQKAFDPGDRDGFFIEHRLAERADEPERWVAATGAVFFENERPVRMVGMIQEITARKRVEDERQKFVSLAEQSLEFIGICSLTLEPLYINPAGAALVGLDRNDMANLRLDDFFFPEDDSSRAEFSESLGKSRHATTEIRFRHFVTGEAIWMLYNAFVLYDDNGEPIGYATVSRDITARKRAEDALKAADRRKDEFLATLAHELRNPLAPIRNAVHVLRHDATPAMTTQRGLTLLGMIERQTDHLIRLVDDLLEVSRITRGKIELKIQRVDVRDVLRHAVETAQPKIDKAQHHLSVRMPPEPIMVDADPVRLAQVFTNLLNNAAKYTEQGGEIGLMLERRGGEAVVTVRDSGLGIPTDMLPRVFDLFTQVDRTLGRAQGGLGIGLALVKSLLELQGGSVEGHSEGLGKGSAFVVRLPAAPEKRRESIMPATASIDRSATRRVLVIDDDQDVADSLVMFLETFGATVHVAYSGPAGLDALASFKPDLVFLDIGMPGMDGYETARRIRALPEGRGVQLVALTGWGQEQISDRAKAAGFDRQLTKPAGVEALQELLASI